MISRTDRWVGLDLRHLQALEAVATTASFARAARELGYSQPAVSQQIAALERIVGQRLVERDSGRRTVALTEAGDVLLRHAHSIGARLLAAQADMDALADGSAGTLRVGTFQSVASYILPSTVQRFRSAWPDVRIELVEHDDDHELSALVEAGELDLAFVMHPLESETLASEELLSDPYVLLVPADSDIVEASPATLTELPLIANRQCRTAGFVEDQLRSRGVEPDVVYRSDDNGTVQRFVGEGLGGAVVPILTVEAGDPRVRVVELGDLLAPRLIAIAWHADRYRSRAAESFVELARERCAELSEHPLRRAAGTARARRSRPGRASAKPRARA